jgi:hypothetical protein
MAVDALGRLATSSGDWNVCYLYLHGLNFDSNLAKLPATTAALSKVHILHIIHILHLLDPFPVPVLFVTSLVPAHPPPPRLAFPTTRILS